jgi:hypothetical protein
MGITRRVRETVTLDGGFSVYKHALIFLAKISPSWVRPTSKYVLTYKLGILTTIESMLNAKGISAFDLRDTVPSGEGHSISPPLVEWDGRSLCIVDGIHRFYLARRNRVSVRAIVVVGASKRFPIIGLPVSWNDVLELHELPTNPADRRNLRPGIADTSAELRKYYRDLSYLGSGGRRPSGEQTG